MNQVDNSMPPNQMPIESKIEAKNKIISSVFLKKPLTKIQSIAIIGTFTILLTIGIFLWFKTKTSQSPPTAYQPTSLRPTSAPLTLALESPIDEQLLTGEEILVKGKTLPDIPVILFTETDTNSTQSDQRGNFEAKIILAPGINRLTVSTFADNGEEKSLALNLVYDDQVKGTKTPQGQEKKEEKTSSPNKVEIGNVESVDTSSLTIEKTYNRGKYKTTIDKNTKIINQDKKTLKLNSLKPDDLAAIIASESAEATSGGKPKKAVKIFVKEAALTAQMKRRAIQGVISNISDNIITLTHQIQTDRIYSLLVDSQTIIKIKGTESATLAELKIGQRIAAVGDLDENGKLLAKRIHVIPGKATGVFKKYPTASPSASLTSTPTIVTSISPTATPTAELSTTPTASVNPTLQPDLTITTTPNSTITP